MRKLAVVLALMVTALSTFGGVATAIEGGSYPPRPVTIVVSSPTVPVGVGFTATGKGLCAGVDARFVLIGSAGEYWTGSVPVGPDGTASYTFSPEELAPYGVGQITVVVKQSSPECFSRASTVVTITSKEVKSPTVVVTPGTPTVADDVKVTAKNVCPNEEVQFTLQNFSTGEYVQAWVMADSSGVAVYTFPASALPGDGGPYLVWAKQKSCSIVVNTTITVKDVAKAAPVEESAPVTKDEGATTAEASAVVTAEDDTKSETAVTAATTSGTAGTGDTTATTSGTPAAVAPTPQAAATVTPVVLSAGLTAPTTATAATVRSGTTAQAAAAAVAPGDTLPVTGGEPSRILQIALTAVLAGIGMIIVTSVRRRTANVRSR